MKDFYEQKLKHDKTSSLYMESKLILNSLYGKFGMSPYKDKHKIFKNLEFNEFLDKINIKDVISLQKVTSTRERFRRIFRSPQP